MPGTQQEHAALAEGRSGTLSCNPLQGFVWEATSGRGLSSWQKRLLAYDLFEVTGSGKYGPGEGWFWTITVRCVLTGLRLFQGKGRKVEVRPIRGWWWGWGGGGEGWGGVGVGGERWACLWERQRTGAPALSGYQRQGCSDQIRRSRFGNTIGEGKEDD